MLSRRLSDIPLKCCAVFQVAIIMEDEITPFPPILSWYVEGSANLRLCYAERERVKANARALGRKPNCETFPRKVTAIAQFVSEANQVGRALLSEIAT
jgi:hypothetical protein